MFLAIRHGPDGRAELAILAECSFQRLVHFVETRGVGRGVDQTDAPWFLRVMLFRAPTILHREWPMIDGTKPMGRGGWRTAWRNLREEAARGDQEKGKPEMARLATLRFYDLRHQYVTELCEAEFLRA